MITKSVKAEPTKPTIHLKKRHCEVTILGNRVATGNGKIRYVKGLNKLFLFSDK